MTQTTVFIEGHNEHNSIFTLNTELYKRDVWLQANKLTLNTANNNNYIVFHRAKQNNVNQFLNLLKLPIN